MVSLTTSAFAQYYGEIKSHEFLIDHEGQHEIRLQSSTTKFNDVFYDEPADVIIISIDSGNTFTDIISIQMNYSSFRTLLADSKDADPSNVLVLLDGEEQEYYTPRIIAGNVAWEFKNKPNITEIELILKPERYRDDKTQDSDFRYPPGSARMAEKYPVKQQYEMGLKFENLKCNEGHVLIQKYDGTPACVTESTKQKLIERGWAESLGDIVRQRSGHSESELLDQLRKTPRIGSMQNFTDAASDFVVSEALYNHEVSDLLFGSEYEVRCCTFSFDRNDTSYNRYVGLVFDVAEKYMKVVVTYDLVKQQISGVGTEILAEDGVIKIGGKEGED